MPVEAVLRFVADAVGLRSWGSAALGRRMLTRLADAKWEPGSILYTVLVNEDLEAVLDLRTKGVKVVHECMLTPEASDWLVEERRRFPGIEPDEDSQCIVDGRRRDRLKYAAVDMVLVPSEFVREAVLRLGCDPAKIALVPYGLDTDRYVHASVPEPGRVLFVGSVGLRKGSHYLAAAARMLNEGKTGTRIRVVGPVPNGLERNVLFHGPEYVGQVPRQDMAREYAAADVFVLPTLAEGMALVHLEALAAGVPVITTPNCGSVVRDGIDGYIVPPRDPSAIADAVKRIVSDRRLRMTMSINARGRAAEFSTGRYATRLLAALDRIT